MERVKSFGTDVQIFHLHQELERLDEKVTQFLASQPRAVLIGASDLPVTDETGKTVGLIRLVSYRD
ncbi:MAG: hypothetical protein HZB55_21890 [Deltaproteobacteria bacterium]|nr:hypothetical protein [Deltaproteobacteria bacterium]